MNLVDWFLNRLSDVASAEHTVDLMKEVGGHCGLRKIRAVPNVTQRDARLANGQSLDVAMGWPESWLKKLRRLDIDIAATRPQESYESYRPFPWRLTQDGQKWNGKTLQGPVLDAARHWSREVKLGITTPVFGLRGREGYVSWMSNDPDCDLDEIFFRYADSLFVIAHYFVEAIDFCPVALDNSDPTAVLTARERECLQWVALGKTDEEIAGLILRSTSTIRFHMKNALRKLGALNRAHAVGITHRHELLGARPQTITHIAAEESDFSSTRTSEPLTGRRSPAEVSGPASPAWAWARS